MADFDDITGWREELKAFEATGEGKVFFRTYRSWGGDKPKAPKLPFATLLHFAEVHLRFPEIETALKKKEAWLDYLNANPDFGRDDEGFDELCPWNDIEIVYDFQRWYAMKAQLAYDGSNLRPGQRIAYQVAIGELPSLKAPETRAYAEKEFPGEIVFSDGGEND
ncbi:hypothetical protein FMN50_01415 [Rhodobacterales bacterium]|nr:hypothetical protein FMN50_01415 [Rhodobacterales bacterium]